MNNDRTRLGTGIVISVAINTFVLVPGLTADHHSMAWLPDEEAAVQPPEFTPEPDEPEVKLGIDESEASTLTWIGYEKHNPCIFSASYPDTSFPAPITRPGHMGL